MKTKLTALALLAVGLTLLALGVQAGIDAGDSPAPTPAPGGAELDAYKRAEAEARGEAPGSPAHPIPPRCGVTPSPAPPFGGLSPLTVVWDTSLTQCSYGDLFLWEANGRRYVVQSGFSFRAFAIWDVTDPLQPQRLVTMPFPNSGGTTSTDVEAFRQGNNHYVLLTMQSGSNPNVTGCGAFIYDVTNPISPTLITRIHGQSLPPDEFWCPVHNGYVSTDANGDGDYVFLTANRIPGQTPGRLRVVDIRNLPNWTQVGGYQHPEATPNDGSIYVHDVNVFGDRVYVDYWLGGLIILSKAEVTQSYTPTPLNPINSIRPAGFDVHHSWPTDDGNYVFIQCEVCSSSPSYAKVRMYDIHDPANPFLVGQIIPPGNAANATAHNLKVMGDTLLVGWYAAGTRGFQWTIQGNQATFTQTLYHQIRSTPISGFVNAWGVDYSACTINSQAHTCLYTSDLTFGLIIDALGYDPNLDPYDPESQITDPVNGQTITTTTYLIRGTAHDYYSGLTGVEVSTDNGANWTPATVVSDTWSYAWSITADGCYFLRSRALDAAGNIQTPTAPVIVGVNTGACTRPLYLPIALKAP